MMHSLGSLTKLAVLLLTSSDVFNIVPKITSSIQECKKIDMRKVHSVGQNLLSAVVAYFKLFKE